MGKEKEQAEKQVNYPQIVSTAPCNDDWFEGQSHKRIASKIADIILDDSQHGIIGIDGGWGSGKSNLVGLTHKAINEKIKDDKKKKYVFVNFDVWAHHTDYMDSSNHLYLIRVPGIDVEVRNMIIEKMAENGVATNVHYKPMPMMTAYKALGFDIKDYPNAYNQFVNEVTLPLHTRLTDEMMEYVISNYVDIIKNL